MFREDVENVWAIDRSEVVDNIYCVENGLLVLKPAHFDLHGWPPGEAEKYAPLLMECFDEGGWFHGLFDQGSMIGVAILAAKLIGQNKDRLQLKFLHLSKTYRRRGLGAQLFELAKTEAHMRSAKTMYISATPSENTIDFYRRLGCVVTQELDPELFALEPEDIHLECEV